MIQAAHLKQANKLIKSFDLDPNAFPNLIWSALMKRIRHFYVAEPWMKVEDVLSHRKDLLLIYANMLFTHDKKNIALSIIKRHNLLEKEHNQDNNIPLEMKAYFGETPSNTYEYLDNLLFSQDEFAPSEELIGYGPKGTYWSFEDLNLSFKKNVFWVDDCNSNRFKNAREKILKADIVGMDAEYKFDDNLNVTGISIFQFATRNSVYIFDAQKLAEETEYHEFLRALFLDGKIVKVKIEKN